jgi:HD-GYP domain-containing protein (c-di-GMP phosphodiesterase class II)
MLKAPTHLPSGRQASLAGRAKALAAVLSAEFEVPFRFHDPQGHEVHPGDGPTALTAPAILPEVVRGLARAGQSEVSHLGQGRYQVTVVVSDGHEVRLIAVGLLQGAAGADPAHEQRRLQKWAQAVADRLRLSEQLVGERRREEEQAAAVNRAWSVVQGLQGAIRQVRLQRDTNASRATILQSAQTLLGVQTVVWAPGRGSPSELIQGESQLAPPDIPYLTTLLAAVNPSLRPGEPVVWNEDRSSLWSAHLPNIANLLATPLRDTARGGWLIAVNKQTVLPAGSTGSGNLVPFRRSDVAALLPFASLLELQVRGSARFGELKELLVGVTRSLTAAIDAKDSSTYGHSERVARIAVELAREMGHSEDQQSDTYLAGLLHDIGKIGIRDSVLQKKGPLTAQEYEHVKEHVTIGYHILADLRPLASILPGVLSHHERYDGKGYPHGLAGEQVPLLARILAVADSYDVMTTRRPCGESLSGREAEERLRAGAGTQWDPGVVEALERCRHRIHLIRQRGVGESLHQALEAALRTGDSTPSDPGPALLPEEPAPSTEG